jgi:toxin ParE1/3/4
LKKLQIIFSPFAAHDIEEIDLWLVGAEGVSNAQKIVNGLVQTIASLSTLYMRGPVVQELVDLSKTDVRQLLYKGFRVLYIINVDQVMIVAVIHQRRDAEAIILSRIADYQ